MPKVTFKCGCPQSIATVHAQKTTDQSETDALIFKTSGSKDMDLSNGEYDVVYRATGTPETDFSLEVTKGGKMNKVERTLPKDGKAGGNRKLVVSALVLWYLGAPAAYAQTADEARQAVQRGLVTLPTVADVQSPGLSVSLDATTDEKKGSVAIVFESPAEALTFGITAKGPLDKDTGEATPITLEGLPSDASAEFAFNYFHWRSPAPPGEIAAFCKKVANKDECDESDFTGANQQDYRRLLGIDSAPWMFTGSASVGRTQFKFASPTDLAAGKENHADWAVSTSAGRYSPNMGYLALEFEYQRTWEAAGAARQICTPFTAVTGAIECRNLVVGGPTRDSSMLARLQWRRFFAGGRAAINPMVVQDLGASVTKVRVPVYFFTDANEGLAGGARVDWDSDSGDARFVVFVGTALSLVD